MSGEEPPLERTARRFLAELARGIVKITEFIVTTPRNKNKRIDRWVKLFCLCLPLTGLAFGKVVATLLS